MRPECTVLVFGSVAPARSSSSVDYAVILLGAPLKVVRLEADVYPSVQDGMTSDTSNGVIVESIGFKSIGY